MGLLPTDLATLKPDATFDTVATAPMRAMRELTAPFADAVEMSDRLPLTVNLTELSDGPKIFDGDASHPPLWQRDAIAVLPWQINARKMVIAVYAMTYDVTKKMGDAPYRLTLGGLPKGAIAVQYLEPISGRQIAIGDAKASAEGRTWELPLSDTPRLLVLNW